MNEKEMNLLENQLRSWQPRRPSPKLKRRLYGSAGSRDGPYCPGAGPRRLETSTPPFYVLQYLSCSGLARAAIPMRPNKLGYEESAR